jgi:hypothetical protein
MFKYICVAVMIEKERVKIFLKFYLAYINKYAFVKTI